MSVTKCSESSRTLLDQLFAGSKARASWMSSFMLLFCGHPAFDQAVVGSSVLSKVAMI